MRRPDRLLVGAVTALMVACAPSRGRGHFDFERMRQQPRRDVWEGSGVFTNGMAMRRPPVHTVPHDPQDPPPSLIASWREDSARLRAGRDHYLVSCAPCHGASGLGGGTVAINLLPTPPPSLRTAAARALSDSALLAIITDGIGRMPPHGWQLAPAERLEVAAWVRHLDQSPPHDSAARADSARAAKIGRAMARWHALDSLRRRQSPGVPEEW